MAATYKSTMGRLKASMRSDRTKDPDYNGQPLRTLQELSDALGVDHSVMRGLLQKYRENAPTLFRMGAAMTLRYNRGAFRDWWRGLPEDVRESAKGTKQC